MYKWSIKKVYENHRWKDGLRKELGIDTDSFQWDNRESEKNIQQHE